MDIKIKKFRLRGKKLFLSYNFKNEKNITKEIILEKIQKQLKYPISKYVIGFYFNKYYIYLELPVAADINNSHDLDLNINNIWYNGEYKIGKKKWSLINKAISGDNYISNFLIPTVKGKILKPIEYLHYLVKEKNLAVAKKIFYENYPELAVQKGDIIIKNLESISKYFSKKKK